MGPTETLTFAFEGNIWQWRGPAPFYFVTVPNKESVELKKILRFVTYGWGMIPATIKIGETEWKTALFAKDGNYIVPLKASVRKAEELSEGDLVAVELQVSMLLA
jgi:hypothetical protein